MSTVTLLDYGAGNVRSVRNALRALGCEVRDVTAPEQILTAEKLVFPGVGAFGSAVGRLQQDGYFEPLRRRLLEGRPFLGICIGLQVLFERSEESLGASGFGLIRGVVRRFPEGRLAVPHMGWNGVNQRRRSALFEGYDGSRLYFVHSYHGVPDPRDRDWVLATTDYGEQFVSAVQKGAVAAVQFHPEKSGAAGLRFLERFLAARDLADGPAPPPDPPPTLLARRIIACLDVRTNDAGDLVVTKGDQYDVREAGEVRNLGRPVELARRYYEEGADEIAFLNITSFREEPLADQPMLEVLRRTSEKVFVPLTIGGGIRGYADASGRRWSALEVASEYFRSGADKVSIGSDAVFAVEAYLREGRASGDSAIEQIARVYGNQAVVISVDPRRVWVPTPDGVPHAVVPTEQPGPNGERYCWFQCTVRGGREGRPVDAVTLARVCEKLGAGEILLNSIDRDGTKAGFDLELIRAVRAAVSIPVIASSGAGSPEHFAEVFAATGVEAALAAGIFHRREVPIAAVKEHLRARGIATR